MAEKLTKNQRREQAREQARVAREQEKKREKRRKLYIQGGVVLGAIAVLAIVGLVLTMTMKPAGPGPKNMASGGFVVGKDLVVEKTAALQPGESRVAPKTDRSKTPLDVTVYVDYSCTHCADFEQTNGSMLETWVGSGATTLEIYPVNILDTAATNKYSTRAANLVSCVVDEGSDPGVAFKLHNKLLSADVYKRFAENSGLSDDELLDIAGQVGVNVDDNLKQCVKDLRFGSFIDQNRVAATTEGILGLAKGAQLADDQTGTKLQPADKPQVLRGTPLIIVNGQEWRQGSESLEQYLLKLQSEIDQKNGVADKEESSSSSSDKAKQ